MQILGIVLIACWIATFVIGFDAFITQDVLLSVSLIGDIPAIVSIIVGIVVFNLPITSMVSKKRSWVFVIAMFAFLIFVLLDVNRLAPYFIFYLALFGLFTYFKNDRDTFVQSLLIIASGIYIASGLHKINPGFSEQILGLIWFHSLPLEPSATAGYVIALTETLLGLGLLFKYTRKVSCVLLLLTHIVLLWKLGPFKFNWNLIVWPWNFCMIAVLFVLYFYEAGTRSLFKALRTKHATVLLFFWIIPAASLFALVPDNLGFKLYSGKALDLDLKFPSKIQELEKYNRSSDSLNTQINLQTYSIRTRQLAISPEPWVFEAIKENFEAYYKTNTTLIDDTKNSSHETHKPK
jgi:uncharacterized membrane protein YphA (DoxX/SURF4 family)